MVNEFYQSKVIKDAIFTLHRRLTQRLRTTNISYKTSVLQFLNAAPNCRTLVENVIELSKANNFAKKRNTIRCVIQ